MRRFAVAAALAFVACNGGGPGGALRLRWQFSDGRDCENAGANSVELRLHPLVMGDAAEQEFDCKAGLAPATVTTESLPGDGTLYLDARSPAGADLYRGALPLGAVPSGAVTVSLYALAAN